MKPFAWRHAGLWRMPERPDDYSFSLALGVTDNPHQGHELLGGWIIPIGIARRPAARLAHLAVRHLQRPPHAPLGSARSGA